MITIYSGSLSNSLLIFRKHSDSPTEGLEVGELGPSFLLCLCRSWLGVWSVPGWKAYSCSRSLWVHLPKICYPARAWGWKATQTLCIDTCSKSKCSPNIWGKIILHSNTTWYFSLFVASAWARLKKGSRSSLGSSSSESESAALSEASVLEVAVLSQALLADWLCDDCDPPNLGSNKFFSVHKGDKARHSERNTEKAFIMMAKSLK